MVVCDGGVCCMSPLTVPQVRFLRLHRDHFVESWQQLFLGAMLRARTDTGVAVTVAARDAGELVRLGLMQMGIGGTYAVTSEGAAI